MNFEKRLQAFVELGLELSNINDQEINEISTVAKSKNGWFDEKEIKRSIEGLIKILDADQLKKWSNQYNFDNQNPKKVGVIMAGNIPFVGFHDLLCVLLAGHHLMAKLSSQDSILMKYIVDKLLESAPNFNVSFPGKLTGMEAVIATGSDNSARYFDYYFKNIPNLIRKNRTSVAVLSGKETQKDFIKLGEDIFSYYGLGCRNVSKVLYPKGFDLTKMLDGFESYSHVANHHKYRNNYDYNKSIYLVNRVAHLDSGYLLLNENKSMVSPISVLYTEEYEDIADCERILIENESKIQCIVSDMNFNNHRENQVSFGNAQYPQVSDYADQVDTMSFLSSLK